jgi:hypothetical protein
MSEPIKRSTAPADERGSAQDLPELANEPRILDRLDEVLTAQGLVAERLPGARLLYLALTSRLLERPVSVCIRGLSSTGKSWLLDRCLELVGDDAFHKLSAFSPKALVHSKVSLVHRSLVVAEASGAGEGFSAYSLRTLLSEGELSFEITEKDPRTKQFRTRVIRRPGPTNLISTSTGISFVIDNENRVLSFELDDNPRATQAILDAWGAKAAGEASAEVDLTPWTELQAWLADGERRVVIPFAKRISSQLGSVGVVRIQRDWIQTLGLVEACAVLHRGSRERDERGRIVAVLDDYAAVRELVEPVIAAGLEASVRAPVRELVEAVAKYAALAPDGVDQKTVAKHLGKSPQAINATTRAACERGWLLNNETRPRWPSRLVLGDPLPDDSAVLPPVEALL